MCLIIILIRQAYVNSHCVCDVHRPIVSPRYPLISSICRLSCGEKQGHEHAHIYNMHNICMYNR